LQTKSCLTAKRLLQQDSLARQLRQKSPELVRATNKEKGGLRRPVSFSSKLLTRRFRRAFTTAVLD